MTAERRSKSLLDYVGYLTPIFLFVMGLYVNEIRQNNNMVLAKVNDIDVKLFKHLTNDELHGPRSLMMTKVEFELYQKFRDQQMGELKADLVDIKKMLLTHDAKDKE
jgi:hypothetical protein